MIESVPRDGVCCSIAFGGSAIVIGDAKAMLAKNAMRTAASAAVASNDLYLDMMIRINYLLLDQIVVLLCCEKTALNPCLIAIENGASITDRSFTCYWRQMKKHVAEFCSSSRH